MYMQLLIQACYTYLIHSAMVTAKGRILNWLPAIHPIGRHTACF